MQYPFPPVAGTDVHPDHHLSESRPLSFSQKLALVFLVCYADGVAELDQVNQHGLGVLPDVECTLDPVPAQHAPRPFLEFRLLLRHVRY